MAQTPTFPARLRRYILTGLLVLVPIALTVFVLVWAMRIVRELLSMVPVPPWAEARRGVQEAAAFLVVMSFVTLVGFIARNSIGRRLIRRFNRVVDHIPLVNRTYHTIRQVSQVVLNRRTAVFREAVLVEYPRRGLWSVGFITSDSTPEIEKAVGEELVHLFVATSPNPTSGVLLLVPRRDLVPLGCSVEDAMKLVISGGMVLPGETDTQDVS